MKQNSGLAHCIKSNRHWDYCGNYQEMNESEIKDETETQQATSEIINSNIMVRQCFNINKEIKMKRNDEALEVYEKVYNDYKKADDNYWSKACKEWKAYKKAGETLNKAWNDYEKAMFPDCTWNGETIFSKEK